MQPRCSGRSVGIFFLVLGLGSSGTARAGGTEDEARAAYDEGATAYEAHDFARATRLFTHADELAPNPMVLKLALAAATQSDDPIAGMTLVLRAESRAVDGSLADLAKAARGRFEGRAGVVRIVCRVHGSCQAAIGDTSHADGELVVVPPGNVEATFTEGSASARAHAVALVKTTVDLVEPPFVTAEVKTTPAAPPPPADSAREPKGLPPIVFFGGLTLTAAVGAFAVASGVDTAAAHRAFLRDPTADSQSHGQSAELRTNVLIAGTALCAVASGVVGLFFTRWHGVREEPQTR